MGLLSTFALAPASEHQPKTSSFTRGHGPYARRDSCLLKDTMSMIEDELLNHGGSEEEVAAAAEASPAEDGRGGEEGGPGAQPELTVAPPDAKPLPRRWIPKSKSLRRIGSKSLRRFGSFTTRARSNSNVGEDDDQPTTSSARRRVPFARRLSRHSSLLSSGSSFLSAAADADGDVLEAPRHVTPTPPSHEVEVHPRPIRRPSILTADEEGSFDDLFSVETTEFDSEAKNPALVLAAMLPSIGRDPTSHELANVAALCEWERIPQYTKSELMIRKHLGKGSFSDVFEITAMIDDPNATKRLDSSDRDGLDRLMDARFEASAAKEDALDREIDAMFDRPSTLANVVTIDGECNDDGGVANKPQDLQPPRLPHCGRRQTMDNHGVRPMPDQHASFCVRKSTNTVRKIQMTYAMKCLRPQIRSDAKQFKVGVEDLVHETAMLSSLDHPNIIQLHGRARFGPDSCLSDGYFIILDRLQDTLEHRIDRWKKEAVSRQPPSTTQLKVARSVAGALAYLHSRDIVFRDLKPQNVGFDSAGVLKLFDFGFATKAKGQLNEICGTRRYMAPEVGLERGYGMPADVHSFGILLWEVCALERPFAKIKSLEEFQLVVFVKGERPKLSRHWDHSIREAMTGCWNSLPGRRPDMDAVKTMLDGVISEASSQQHRRQGTNKDPLSASLRKSLMFRRQSQ